MKLWSNGYPWTFSWKFHRKIKISKNMFCFLFFLGLKRWSVTSMQRCHKFFGGPICNRKNVLQTRHLFFGAFISSASQIMKEEIYCQNIGTNTLNSRFKFLDQITCLGSGALQNCQNLDHGPICNKFIYW